MFKVLVLALAVVQYPLMDCPTLWHAIAVTHGAYYDCVDYAISQGISYQPCVEARDTIMGVLTQIQCIEAPAPWETR